MRRCSFCALWIAGAVVALLAATVEYAWCEPFVKWESVNEGLNLGNGIVEVAVGGHPPIVYVIVDGAGLYRSDNLGASWVRLQGDYPCLAAPYTAAVSPTDGNLVYCAVATPNGGLWRSSDGGKRWAKCGDAASGMASDDVESVAFLPTSPNLVLIGHRAGRAISVSVDGGKTWSTRELPGTVQNGVKQQLLFPLSDAEWVLASRGQSGIWYTTDAGATWTVAEGATGYFPGPLPVVQVGQCFFSSQHHGFNKSADGGKTWKFVMEKHTRMLGAAGEYVFREHRTGIRGTDDRILTIEMSGNYGQSWGEVTGALQQVVPPGLRSNIIVANSVDPYAHVRVATAWGATPDGRTVFLGLGRAGLYRGRLMWTPKGPWVLRATLDPLAVREGDTTTRISLQAVASTREGRVARVHADLGAIGQPDIELWDDGKHGDDQAGDKIYGNAFTLAPGIAPGEKVIGVIAQDEAGNVSSNAIRLVVTSTQDRMVIWDGEQFAQGLSYASPPSPLNFIRAQTDEAHSGKVALEFHGEGSGWIGGGWNWHGWWPPDSGTDIRSYHNLSFWMKAVGNAKPAGISVGLNCSSTKQASGKLNVVDYCLDAMDGQWHEIVIPLKDLLTEQSGFDPTKAWEFDVEEWSPQHCEFSVFIDDIAFDNRRARPHSEWVTLPEPRQPSPLGPQATRVNADVDIRAAGTPISPYIYGAAMGDRKAAVEQGLTILRAGGNPVTPFNWKRGFGAKGADWYFQNEGTETVPENTWLAKFHGENKRAGLETYLTIPMMGRVAKDGTSVAFDTRKYPDQESWAGKSQPTDPLPHAGNGRQLVRGPDGNVQVDANGRPVLREIEPDPDETSVEMSPEEQARMLEFMINNMNYGTANQGGVKYIALDNEPSLWHSTHRGMHPAGCSYDELWERTLTYGTLLKKIDPGVKLAGPAEWGWTGYFYSGLDQQLAAADKASWDSPPDFAAHGSQPLVKWWLTKLNQYEKQTGQRLVDVLDLHFYPQTGIYMAGAPNDPKTMEARVQETRVLWDPDWVDPSWMAGDPNGRRVGGRIRLIRMMKEWVAECNPGMLTAIGEYNFGGEQDVSGGVAQAELLGVFAREGLDFAFFWFFPAVNSPQYFAFKMFRNPDGHHTAFGDRYLPAKCDAPEDVSVHVAKDANNGRLTFLLVNKRAAKPARVTLNLTAPVPAQEAVVYEYSNADRFAIGQLPPVKFGGNKLEVDLPSMSVLRFDLKQ